MKKYFSINNIITFAIVAFAIYSFVPKAYTNFKLQGVKTSLPKELVDINGNSLHSKPPYTLVFWASWCKPCDVELGRINSMIEDGSLKASKIIAVSIDSNLGDIKKAVEKNQYLFPVVWDSNHELSSIFKVQGTPTIVIIDKDSRINWVTTGLSPSLGIRLKHYLK